MYKLTGKLIIGSIPKYHFLAQKWVILQVHSWRVF